MSNKVLVICGPTGVGKTDLGISLAKKFNGEIISADSRQVYKKLDLSTGKDLEHAKRAKGWWEIEGVPIHLVDIVEPDENFSVARYQHIAKGVLNEILSQRRLPILIGGTGLYIKAVIDGIDTLDIPPNEELRSHYKSKSTGELLMILARFDPELANSLNKSEQSNKQRLVRRIEVAQLGMGHIAREQKKPSFSTLFIGLIASDTVLREQIGKRIDQWFRSGAEEEVRNLLDEGISWENQAMSALGYKQWQPYFEGQSTKEEVVSQWKTEEYQYAKRQLTWFRKDPRVVWFDTTESTWREDVDKLISNWYHR